MGNIVKFPLTEIIVSDDDQGIRETLAEFLTISRYRTYEAHSAEGAFELIEQHSVDLVITDYSKPDMDGFEFTRLVKAKFGIFVIIATGCKGLIKEVEAKEAGADILMFKPVQLDELLANIRSILSKN